MKVTWNSVHDPRELKYTLKKSDPTYSFHNGNKMQLSHLFLRGEKLFRQYYCSEVLLLIVFHLELHISPIYTASCVLATKCSLLNLLYNCKNKSYISICHSSWDLGAVTIMEAPVSYVDEEAWNYLYYSRKTILSIFVAWLKIVLHVIRCDQVCCTIT